MKIDVLKGDILEALQKVQYSASGKGIMPILSGVKIESSESEVVLSATDLESYTVSSFQTAVKEKGSCVVNLKTLLEYLRDSSDEKLEIECEENELRVVGTKSRIRIYTMPVEDFPAHPRIEKMVLEGLEAGRFFNAVNKVSRAASKDEKRPTLMGVYFEIREGVIRLVSTDRYRLTVKEVTGEFKVEEEGEFIVPASSLVNLARVAGKAGKINMMRDENKGQLKFEAEGLDHFIRLIEGKFPKYEQFIPEETRTNIEVDKKEMIDAIKRISLINNTVKISAKQGLLILEGESREVGEGKEELEVLQQGEDINIAFNASFLEDGLQSLEGEKALIGVNESLKPGVVTEKEGADFKYIIMPIRL